MSSGYKVKDSTCPHFVTITVVEWCSVFIREIYQQIFLDSLQYCREKKGLRIHAWVIMPNHAHLIVSTLAENDLPGIMRDLKKFTASKLISSISGNPRESARERWLSIFRESATQRHNVREMQFWQHEYHPVRLDTLKMFEQRLNYLHNNPVKIGLVRQAVDYRLSSAAAYSDEGKNLELILPVDKIDW